MACTLTLDSLGSVMAVLITESLWLGPLSGGKTVIKKQYLCYSHLKIFKNTSK